MSAMLTQASLLEASLSDIGSDPTLLWIRQCEIDLPMFEAKGVVHWSYPELFPSPAHFVRRSQQISAKDMIDLNEYFGIPFNEIRVSDLQESDLRTFLSECMNGTPFLDAQLKELGAFRWAVHCMMIGTFMLQ